MSSNFVDTLIGAFEKSSITAAAVVSFKGESLKLDTETDAKVIVDAISECADLECLNLEGNTLGVDAARAIAKALEMRPKLKRALWKDLFTGRMKTEIPKALQFLGNGLVKADARLTELDLSDNAFGPIGVEGLASLLRSSTCYALEKLRLNNNGLGITGGKLLASALTDCYNCSKQQGTPLCLKVFVAGRNRLENDGAKALAQVFKIIGTLEEVAMPQNGIYHVGIKALCDAFICNTNLQILNLNDNTIGPQGANEIRKILLHLQKLKIINFGDCLLKTKGALRLAEGLKTDHNNLEELILGFNEIGLKGGIAIANAMNNKFKLKNLLLDGNSFNSEARKQIEETFKSIGGDSTLLSIDECESEEDDEESEEESEHEDEIIETVSYEKFLNVPTGYNFYNLGTDREDKILKEIQKSFNLTDVLPIIMQISALGVDKEDKIASSAVACSIQLYKELYIWAEKNDNLSLVNNTVLVYLGLIKSEDKKFKQPWKTDACISTLKEVLKQNCIPQKAIETLNFFLERESTEIKSK
ncbi:hypothetical protein FQA39_LY14092 [Lamprigera yunnana]|nr:hypothetical protein FQA39_LY14092 [Lamprigera yunnana]